MYSIRKNFIFHNKKVVEFITQQPNQSNYIESLVFKDILSTEIIDIFDLLKNHKQYLETSIQTTKTIENDFTNSIANVLNL